MALPCTICDCPAYGPPEGKVKQCTECGHYRLAYKIADLVEGIFVKSMTWFIYLVFAGSQTVLLTHGPSTLINPLTTSEVHTVTVSPPIIPSMISSSQTLAPNSLATTLPAVQPVANILSGASQTLHRLWESTKTTTTSASIQAAHTEANAGYWPKTTESFIKHVSIKHSWLHYCLTTS